MDVRKIVNTNGAQALLTHVCFEGNDALKHGVTSLDVLRDGTFTAEQIAGKISWTDHARLCYFSGECSIWRTFLTLFGLGPKRTEDTYVKILSALGFSPNNDGLLIQAKSLKFVKVDASGMFVFKDHRNNEVKMANLSELNKCKHLTALIIHSDPSIESMDISQLTTLKHIDFSQCENLSTLTLPQNGGEISEIRVTNTKITNLDISNCRHLTTVYAHDCPCLNKITGGQNNGELRDLKACNNPMLKNVSLQFSEKCAQINLRDCPSLTTLEHPQKFVVNTTIFLTGCGQLSSTTRDSLAGITKNNDIHMDKKQSQPIKTEAETHPNTAEE
ncbi:MAG: hypothetical protein LBD72_03365 [Puniceicoccales bacterium]|jgi:hypothetical protein|nr:hypothetical protein [Puniceicoccales bacterium]